MLVVRYGMLRLGIGPTTGEVVRMVAFFVVAVVYIALWLALATLLSVVPSGSHRGIGGHRHRLVFHIVRRIDRRPGRRHGPPRRRQPDGRDVLANARLEQNVRRFSPPSSTRKPPACC